MQRLAETYFQNWLHKTGRKPLVIRGARQVGKSTLVRQAAEACGRVLYEVNLERHPELQLVFNVEFDILEIADFHNVGVIKSILMEKGVVF